MGSLGAEPDPLQARAILEVCLAEEEDGEALFVLGCMVRDGVGGEVDASSRSGVVPPGPDQRAGRAGGDRANFAVCCAGIEVDLKRRVVAPECPERA